MAKRAKGAIQIKERQSGSDSDVSGSAWGPLREPIFRALWMASVASNVGSWMQDVGESWLMISLTKSPIYVALVETAGSLPRSGNRRRGTGVPHRRRAACRHAPDLWPSAQLGRISTF